MWKRLDNFLLISLVSLSIHAGIPNPTATTMFAPPNGLIEPNDVPLLGTMLSLPLYQDSEDSDLFYYVPPFRILQFDQGAASILLHSVKSENIYQADSIMKKMQSEELVPPEHIINSAVIASKREALEEESERLKQIEKRTIDSIEKIEGRIIEIEAKLETAINDNNERMVEYLRSFIQENLEKIEKKQEILKQEKADTNTMRAAFDAYVAECLEKWRHEKMRTRLWPVTTYLASAGKSIDMALYPDTEDLTVAIHNSIDELKRSYGGSLSMSIYSGFTQKQVDDITFLRSKYWPHVKIVLMASTDLQFESLAELEDSKNGTRQNVMFKNMRGSGGYQGASVNFDLTIDGAMSLGTALGPFIVPVGITANITEKMLPFEAEVKCDFSDHNGLQGNTTIREGRVVFENDLLNISGLNSTETTKCQTTVFKGDQNSAHVFALKEIEKELDKINVTKTSLTRKESKKYYTRVIRDLEAGKLAATTVGQKLWLDYLPKIGTGPDAIKVLSDIDSIYWQTDSPNLNRMLAVKFSKKISYQGHQMVRKSLPAHLCLFYNAKKQGYDRCTNSLEEQAEHPLEAAKLAVNSPSCQGLEEIKDCFDKRRKEAPELRPEDEDDDEKDDILEL